ncbi:hypothetical protein DUNSADRAFT_17665 [Dunaliella salina]|nr:hypothetical protein DUNSADRAFT_17665 [Dunaliella salina]|eukprot:KAF5828407.1 hypothetical protein DUNSADRAFT_17665 [Dunaliella salina]
MGTAAQDGLEDLEDEAARNGWAVHPQPFRWPVPKSPREYVAHPHAPSDFRRAQLAEPWEEGAMLTAVASPARTGPPPGHKDFVTTVNTRDRTGIQDGLFGKDPAFWQTVHESGTVQDQREREVREKEKMEWTKRLVVDNPVMHSTFPYRNKPTQEDRFSHILHDEPMKKSLQRSYVPPPPLSMNVEMPWSGETALKLPKIDSSTFLVPGKDFKNALTVPKRDVSKLGPGQYQSWTASIHDKIYSQY